MRVALVSLAMLAFAIPLGWAATPGSLSVEDGRGTVVVRGKGIVIGRLERGEVQIVDLTPLDQWSPRVNGVPRGRTVWLRGRDVNFYVPGGRYRITVRGDGFSLSVEDGRGTVVVRGKGIVIGRLERGEVQIVDLTPLDQ